MKEKTQSNSDHRTDLWRCSCGMTVCPGGRHYQMDTGSGPAPRRPRTGRIRRTDQSRLGTYSASSFFLYMVAKRPSNSNVWVHTVHYFFFTWLLNVPKKQEKRISGTNLFRQFHSETDVVCQIRCITQSQSAAASLA